MSPTIRSLALVALVACARAPEPVVAQDAGVNQYGQALPASSTPIYATGFKPASPKHPGRPGDLPELACAAAVKMGCGTDATQCKMQLREKGDDKMWSMRMGTVLDAKTKKELDDTTVIPCKPDAGTDQ